MFVDISSRGLLDSTVNVNAAHSRIFFPDFPSLKTKGILSVKAFVYIFLALSTSLSILRLDWMLDFLPSSRNRQPLSKPSGRKRLLHAHTHTHTHTHTRTNPKQIDAFHLPDVRRQTAETSRQKRR